MGEHVRNSAPLRADHAYLAVSVARAVGLQTSIRNATIEHKLRAHASGLIYQYVAERVDAIVCVACRLPSITAFGDDHIRSSIVWTLLCIRRPVEYHRLYPCGLVYFSRL